MALRGAVGLEQSRQCAKAYSCRTSLEIPARKPCLQSRNWRERGREVRQGGHRGVIKGFHQKQRGKTERENSGKTGEMGNNNIQGPGRRQRG